MQARVVMAIMGNVAMRGCASTSATPFVPAMVSLVIDKTTNGTTKPMINGGCTIGPNRLLRFTNTAEPTQPRKNTPRNIVPSELFTT
jgi:hypothetical protein